MTDMQNPRRLEMVAPLLEAATEPLVEGFKTDSDKEDEIRSRHLEQRVRRLVQHAYAEGLRDGFVQGCHAASSNEGRDA